MKSNFSSNGTSYEISGNSSQTILVFIHGLGLNKDMWQYQINEFKREYCILTYDLFGHGRSSRSKKKPSLSIFTQQLHELLEELKFSKVILLGFSLGGMIARHFTKTYPSIIDGLVILNSPHKRSDTAQNAVLKRFLQVRDKGPSSTVGDAIKRWFTPEFNKKHKETTDLVRTWVISNDADVYSENYHVLVTGVDEVIGLNGMISCPTLVLTSDHDFGNGPEMAQAIAKEILGARLIIIQGLRHMALFERPKEINDHLHHFFKMVLSDEW